MTRARIAALACLLGTALTSGHAQAQASAAVQFDLVCNGMNQSADGSSGPVHMQFRFDLARRVYCDGGCERLKPVVVGPTILISQEQFPGGIKMVLTIDRTTGKMEMSGVSTDGNTAGMAIGHMTGDCVRAAFSGMPTNQF